MVTLTVHLDNAGKAGPQTVVMSELEWYVALRAALTFRDNQELATRARAAREYAH